MTPAVPPAILSETMVRALLAWYHTHKRSMPWRDHVSPYRTWISEIMLQQTQVDTVRGFFARFMARFPDVHTLAAADEREVLGLWAGLGYYSRARNLHRAARLSLERHGGLPARKEDWATLPGVGPYTLGAVRSIAFGEPEALVDGNVLRVIARLLELDVRRGASKDEQRVWAVARRTFETSPAARAAPGDWNQALMELGARICSAEAPACSGCPVRLSCRAQQSGEPARFPRPKIAAERIALRLHAAWVERAGRVLLVERPRPGLWAGMWAFPSSLGALTRLPAVLTELGAQAPARGELMARVARTLTHRELDISLHRFEARGRLRGRWVEKRELAAAGMPAAFAALIDSAAARR